MDLVGLCARCRKGRIGIITARKGDVWVGVGLYDGLPWQSKNPMILLPGTVPLESTVLARVIKSAV